MPRACRLPGLLGTQVVDLRDYQRRAVDEIHRRFDRGGGGRQLLYLPCGSGKTESALAWVDEELQAGRRVFVLTDRLPLLDQTIARARRASLPLDVLHRHHDPPDPDSRLVVTTVQTLKNRVGQLPWLPDSVVLDEAHISYRFAHEFCEAAAGRGGRALGLSATPIGPGLYTEWSGIVCGATHAELVRRGHLVDAVAEDRAAKVRYTDSEMSGVRRNARGEWADGATAEVMARFTRPIARDLADRLMRDGATVPRMLVFGATKKHAAGLVSAIAEELGVEGRCVVDETPEAERREAIAEFDVGAVNVLGSVCALAIGFDSPKAEVLVSARPLSRSVAMWRQMTGRIERPADGKTLATILDYVGNAARFRRPVNRLNRSGVSALPPSSVRRRGKRAWECGRCHNANTNATAFCATCGFGREWYCRGDGCAASNPFDTDRCAECGMLRDGWAECPECRRVQHISIGCCEGCGRLRPPAADAALCDKCGMPLEKPSPGRPGKPNLLVCTMGGCGFEFDPDGARMKREETERRERKERERKDYVDRVDRQPEPGRTLIICAARRLDRRDMWIPWVAQRWAHNTFKKVWGSAPTPDLTRSIDALEGDTAAAVAALEADGPVREKLVRLWLEGAA